MNRQQQHSYRFYATLLDAYTSYVNCEEVWLKYWGKIDNPTKSLEEFEAEQFGSLINSINRVPFDSEKADRGTVFNEVVDMMILGKAESRKVAAVSDKVRGVIAATLIERPHRIFIFPLEICRELTDYYKGAMPQVWTEGILPTSRGDVLLCGYIDELMPSSVHDIKTTGEYSVGQFRNHWQHRVYPYCLERQGMTVSGFEYNVVEFNKNGNITSFTEQYTYRPERDIAALQGVCEDFIAFIENNRSLITDTKIFGQ